VIELLIVAVPLSLAAAFVKGAPLLAENYLAQVVRREKNLRDLRAADAELDAIGEGLIADAFAQDKATRILQIAA
jgi:hypothetical protein